MAIKLNKLKDIIALGKCLVITFIGLPFKNTGRACVYTYHGRFSLEGERLVCPGIDYTRHISKIIMIRKGDQLLFGKRCRKCGAAVPKSHGNCFNCYSTNIEVS